MPVDSSSSSTQSGSSANSSFLGSRGEVIQPSQSSQPAQSSQSSSSQGSSSSRSTSSDYVPGLGYRQYTDTGQFQGVYGQTPSSVQNVQPISAAQQKVESHVIYGASDAATNLARDQQQGQVYGIAPLQGMNVIDVTASNDPTSRVLREQLASGTIRPERSTGILGYYANKQPNASSLSGQAIVAPSPTELGMQKLGIQELSSSLVQASPAPKSVTQQLVKTPDTTTKAQQLISSSPDLQSSSPTTQDTLSMIDKLSQSDYTKPVGFFDAAYNRFKGLLQTQAAQDIEKSAEATQKIHDALGWVGKKIDETEQSTVNAMQRRVDREKIGGISSVTSQIPLATYNAGKPSEEDNVIVYTLRTGLGMANPFNVLRAGDFATKAVSNIPLTFQAEATNIAGLGGPVVTIDKKTGETKRYDVSKAIREERKSQVAAAVTSATPVGINPQTGELFFSKQGTANVILAGAGALIPAIEGYETTAGGKLPAPAINKPTDVFFIQKEGSIVAKGTQQISPETPFFKPPVGDQELRYTEQLRSPGSPRTVTSNTVETIKADGSRTKVQNIQKALGYPEGTKFVTDLSVEGKGTVTKFLGDKELSTKKVDYGRSPNSKINIGAAQITGQRTSEFQLAPNILEQVSETTSKYGIPEQDVGTSQKISGGSLTARNALDVMTELKKSRPSVFDVETTRQFNAVTGEPISMSTSEKEVMGLVTKRPLLVGLSGEETVQSSAIEPIDVLSTQSQALRFPPKVLDLEKGTVTTSVIQPRIQTIEPQISSTGRLSTRAAGQYTLRPQTFGEKTGLIDLSRAIKTGTTKLGSELAKVQIVSGPVFTAGIFDTMPSSGTSLIPSSQFSELISSSDFSSVSGLKPVETRVEQPSNIVSFSTPERLSNVESPSQSFSKIEPQLYRLPKTAAPSPSSFDVFMPNINLERPSSMIFPISQAGMSSMLGASSVSNAAQLSNVRSLSNVNTKSGIFSNVNQGVTSQAAVTPVQISNTKVSSATKADTASAAASALMTFNFNPNQTPNLPSLPINKVIPQIPGLPSGGGGLPGMSGGGSFGRGFGTKISKVNIKELSIGQKNIKQLSGIPGATLGFGKKREVSTRFTQNQPRSQNVLNTIKTSMTNKPLIKNNNNPFGNNTSSVERMAKLRAKKPKRGFKM